MRGGLLRWIKIVLGILGTHRKEEAPAYQTVRQTQRKKVSMISMNGAMENKTFVTQVLLPSYTRRLKPEPDATSSEIKQRPDHTTVEPLLLAWQGMTDTGKVRSQNEDNFSCLVLANETLFVVADGMGGHDAGEIASKIAVDMVCRQVREGAGQNQDPVSLLKYAVQMANDAVRQEGRIRGSNMGTTLSVALVIGNIAYIANVGDSRVYWIENGSITQITEDHSLVGKLVAAGKLTREEARKHPQSNLLYRTVGTDDSIKVDTFRVELKRGGSLLLCTDGLWGEVTEENIHHVFVMEKDIRKACAQLMQMANDNGGLDNITAVVAQVA
jgi:PPM family protein phosphatase